MQMGKSIEKVFPLEDKPFCANSPVNLQLIPSAVLLLLPPAPPLFSFLPPRCQQMLRCDMYVLIALW